MDERSNAVVVKAMALTLILIYVGIFVSCIWKYVSTGDITNSTMEIILIVVIPFAITWFARKDERLTLPKDMTGKLVPTEDNLQSKRLRKRHYFWSALGFATFILILTVITAFFVEKDWQELMLLPIPNLPKKMNVIITLTAHFILGIIVYYIIGYILGERSIRKYNRKIDELENNDE